LISLINNAKNSVYFLVFSFTDKDIANALISAKNRGVLVKGVLDKDWNENSQYSVYENLINNKVNVKYDGSYFKLHDKVLIVDGNITVTGSYNFTNSANNNNNENSLIIYSKDIAKSYLNEFDKIYSKAIN
jgi:phosphatidylserine/phosphatidylglycerophosphate/cardiolipin synthase-like enzyme